MTKVDPRWSLDVLLRDYRPPESWRDWFAEAYRKAMTSAQPDEQLQGWKTAAVIFGDMHVPVFCLFVCQHGRTLVPADSQAFLDHIHLCLWELGLATPSSSDETSAAPLRAVGNPDTFNYNAEAARAWFAEQLQPFGGNVERAAVFAMRLTAERLGLLPTETIGETP